LSRAATTFWSCSPGEKVLITLPRAFERTVVFALDDDATVIREMIRQTLED